jgi:hypothetical protein
MMIRVMLHELRALGHEASALEVIGHEANAPGAMAVSHESAQPAAMTGDQIDPIVDNHAGLTVLEMMRRLQASVAQASAQVIAQINSAAIGQMRIGAIVKGDGHLGVQMRGQLDSVAAASRASSAMVTHALSADRPVRTESVARARLTAIVLAESDQSAHSAATETIAARVEGQVRDLDGMTGLGSLGLAVVVREPAGQVIDQRAPTAPLGVSAT